MAETPNSAYDLRSAVSTATAANVPLAGYLVTTVSDGVAVATTSLLGSGTTGTYDGLSLTTSTAGKVVQLQTEGRVPAAYVSTIGTSTSAAELVTVDSTGKPQRQSAGAGTVIGIADKLGNLWLQLPCPPEKTKGVSAWARHFALIGAS